MSNKQGEDLLILTSKRKITTTRLWIVRIIMLFWTASVATQWPGKSLFYAFGSLIGVTAVYWVFVRIVSDSAENEPVTVVAESPQPAEDAILDTLDANKVTTKTQLQNEVFEHTEYETPSECWDKFIEPYLDNHQKIEQMDSSGRRWTLA